MQHDGGRRLLLGGLLHLLAQRRRGDGGLPDAAALLAGHDDGDIPVRRQRRDPVRLGGRQRRGGLRGLGRRRRRDWRLGCLAQRYPLQSNAVPCEVQRVLQQHGNGHRAHTSRHWRDVGRDALGLLEVDVADQAVPQLLCCVLDGVDAHIDDNAAGLEPLAAHELCLADGGDDDVGLADVRHHVASAGVADSDRGVHGLQEL
mmetsp:Transcript_40458/g.101614  ORF Transcript_40458/g.101614 Transcript_40458/m.101614 type:complete len:202 (+) Transcript_40458:259-864(+)